MSEVTEMREVTEDLKAQIDTLQGALLMTQKAFNKFFDEEEGIIPALMDRVYGLEVTVEGIVLGVEDATKIMRGEPIERRTVN